MLLKLLLNSVLIIVNKQASVRSMSSNNVRKIFNASVKAVQPDVLIRNSIRVSQRHLVVRGKTYELSKPCYVVGFGKAVHRMAIELKRILSTNLQRAVLTVPKGTFKNKEETLNNPNLMFIEGAENNLPDEDAQRGAVEIKELVESLKEDDLLVVLISGGGSALLPLPKPPITLAEKLDVIRKLSRRGADIRQLNCVRKQLSVLKGGGLAELAFPARIVSLILSDIVGDPIDFIASGPTVVNHDTPEMAIEVLQRHSLYDQIPDSIKLVLNNQGGYRRPEIDIRVDNYVIGNNSIAAEAAKHHAVSLGYQSIILSTQVEGDVEVIASAYIQLVEIISSVMEDCTNKQKLEIFLNNFQWRIVEETIQDILKFDFRKPICIVLGGEPTVVVKGTGKGGRNQQLALHFGLLLSKSSNAAADILFLSCGTDGADGPTDAAGAVVGVNLEQEAKEQGLDPWKYLENNDSYTFFEKFRNGECLVKTGHTGTNVMDMHIIVVEPKI